MPGATRRAPWSSLRTSKRRASKRRPCKGIQETTMSAVIPNHAPAHGGHDHDHDDHHGAPAGLMLWVTTTNHKDIGTMYLWFSFIMFLVGGVMALTIRAELFVPGM